MRTLPLLCLLALLSYSSSAQKLSFDKKTLKVNEPFEQGKEKTSDFTVVLLASDLPSTLPQVTVQVGSESTYPISKVSIPTATIATLSASNNIVVRVTTDEWSDSDKYVLLTANWTVNNEIKQVRDTLFIKNSWPFKASAEADYKLWNDGKSAEIFIGSNFDFLDSKVTLADWYGGVRVFLPSITNLRFNSGKGTRTPRYGLAGGVYHARSLSNFGNPLNNTEYTSTYGRITGYVADSVFVRYDTVKTKYKTEINNWGLYLAPLYQWSRFESSTENFITNIFIGAHVEVIRRNITTAYTFDTLNTTTEKYRLREILRGIFPIPQNNTQTYYDAYFGISMPIQFLWKDIMDLKVNPCIGIGSRGYSTQVLTRADEKLKKSPNFYLVQFDMLARLGGIHLNIGGEVRGYFPNENPIITAYLGTSLSIQKLVDFVSK